MQSFVEEASQLCKLRRLKIFHYTALHEKKNLSPTKQTTILSCADFCAESDGVLGFFCTGLVFEIIAILVLADFRRLTLFSMGF